MHYVHVNVVNNTKKYSVSDIHFLKSRWRLYDFGNYFIGGFFVGFVRTHTLSSPLGKMCMRYVNYVHIIYVLSVAWVRTVRRTRLRLFKILLALLVTFRTAIPVRVFICLCLW